MISLELKGDYCMVKKRDLAFVEYMKLILGCKIKEEENYELYYDDGWCCQKDARR